MAENRLRYFGIAGIPILHGIMWDIELRFIKGS
jgi:hypothetical protein